MIEIPKTVECNAQSPLQEKLYGKYSVHVLCDALNVPRGTFYNHIKRNKRDNVWHKKRREYFCDEIRRIFEENSQIFVARKIAAVLKTNSTQLIKSTVKIAIESRHPNKGLIFHNDHGANYTSATFSRYLAENGITQSFSKVRNPYDNSVAENFSSILKTECIYRTKLNTYKEARLLIDEYIYFYNNQRIQLKTKLTPMEYRSQYVA